MGDVNVADAVALLRRHNLLAVYGLLIACLLATFSAYRLDGTTLVSRTAPAYQSRAVVAVRPGAEHPTTTSVPATTVPAPPPSVAPGDATAAATTTPASTTTLAVPPLAPLSAVIDSRAMYYTALSLKTIVVSPGFAEAVKARAPVMDGSVTAVVAQDTNTMDVVVEGSTPAIAAITMSAALAELQSVVATYSATPATRFALDGVVISAPSTPSATTSIKGPLTFVVVLAVVLVLCWFLIRAVDAVARTRRRSKPPPAPSDLDPPHPAPRASGVPAQPHNGQRATPTAPVR
jgi:hypothetical protein